MGANELSGAVQIVELQRLQLQPSGVQSSAYFQGIAQRDQWRRLTVMQVVHLGPTATRDVIDTSHTFVGQKQDAIAPSFKDCV
jgi:hypothetical protein